MLNIGGNVTSSGLTPTVTAVKITLTEDSSGNKLLLNVEAARIYDYYTGQRIAYLRTYDLPNPGDYTLDKATPFL